MHPTIRQDERHSSLEITSRLTIDRSGSRSGCDGDGGGWGVGGGGMGWGVGGGGRGDGVGGGGWGEDERAGVKEVRGCCVCVCDVFPETFRSTFIRQRPNQNRAWSTILVHCAVFFIMMHIVTLSHKTSLNFHFGCF